MNSPVLVALYAALSAGEDPSYRRLNGLSMSSLGGCRRKGAYLVANTEPEPRDEDTITAQAEVGTALHRAVLPVMAELLGGEYEVETVLTIADSDADYKVPGTIDLLLPQEVVDLKTTGSRSYDFLTKPRISWVMQVTAGALATERDYCRVILLDRDTGRRKEFSWLAEDKHRELLNWLRSAHADPDSVARDYKGPGIDRECDWCQFSKRCWPDVEGAAPQSVLVHDDPGTASMLASYLEADDRLREATADKKFARECLSASQEGRYGAYELGWRKSRGRESLDATEARRLLEAASLPIPVKQGSPSTAISVRMVPE